MSTGLTNAQVKQYDDMVTMLFQQKYERLRKFAQAKYGVHGVMCSFDRIGESEMDEITGQLDVPTRWLNPQNKRRWARKRDFTHPVQLGVNEELEIILDMRSAYARNGAAAAARRCDQLIIEAITATALEGAEGTVSSAFDTTAPTTGGAGGNQLASGATGMTQSKMELAKEVFNDREVGVDEQDADGFVMVMTAKQMRELMTDTRTVSRDFYEPLSGQKMPLVNGMIPYYMGFHLVLNSRYLPLNASGEKLALAWHRDAVGFGMWAEMLLRIDELPTYNYATGITVQKHMGAVRVDDRGVLAISTVL
jgi:uncharacterized protein (DUF697 family)